MIPGGGGKSGSPEIIAAGRSFQLTLSFAPFVFQSHVCDSYPSFYFCNTSETWLPRLLLFLFMLSVREVFGQWPMSSASCSATAAAAQEGLGIVTAE